MRVLCFERAKGGDSFLKAGVLFGMHIGKMYAL